MKFMNTARTKSLLGINCNNLGTLLGVLTGHIILNQHMHSVGLKGRSICELCFDEEKTVIYFLCTCRGLKNQRLQCFLPEDYIGELRI